MLCVVLLAPVVDCLLLRLCVFFLARRLTFVVYCVVDVGARCCLLMFVVVWCCCLLLCVGCCLLFVVLLRFVLSCLFVACRSLFVVRCSLLVDAC